MLKIMFRVGPDGEALVLQGRLAGAAVANAEIVWSSMVSRSQTTARASKRLTVDLCGVTYVDERGKEMLRAVQQQGGEVRANGAAVMSIISEVRKDDSALDVCAARES